MGKKKADISDSELKKTGYRIMKAREKLGLMQKYLVNKMNVDPTTVSYWESGQRDPGKRLFKLSVLLDTNVDYLKGDSDDDSPDPRNKYYDVESDLFFADIYPARGPKFKAVPIIDVPLNKDCIFDTMQDVVVEDEQENESIEKKICPIRIDWNIISKYPVNENDIADYLWLLREENLHAIQVTSDSMSPEIQDSDYVVFATTNKVRNGDVVVAIYNERLIIRRISITQSTNGSTESSVKIKLEADNKEYNSIVLTEKDWDKDNRNFCVLGNVVYVISKPRKLKERW